jgi:exodeoxyribonuclease V alpha subunit
MQIENDYDKEVCDGNIGTIEGVDPDAGEIVVSFAGRSVTYGFGELDMLVPAYAATIHKSQGSEYPAVIIPVLTQHYAMLQQNLLYQNHQPLTSGDAGGLGKRRRSPSPFVMPPDGAGGQS